VLLVDQGLAHFRDGSYRRSSRSGGFGAYGVGRVHPVNQHPRLGIAIGIEANIGPQRQRCQSRMVGKIGSVPPGGIADDAV
jgi:hypothetical protein